MRWVEIIRAFMPCFHPSLSDKVYQINGRDVSNCEVCGQACRVDQGYGDDDPKRIEWKPGDPTPLIQKVTP